VNQDIILSRVSPCPETGCWLWVGRYGPRDYGQIRPGRGEKEYRAHRLSWLIFRGTIPAGMVVRHRCDVTACVNPDHLVLGTVQDNSDDCVQRRRQWTAGLTGEQAQAIRLRRAAGETLMALAAEFGVSHLTIHRIAAGKLRWLERHGQIGRAVIAEAFGEET
jgi:hypothetical protein